VFHGVYVIVSGIMTSWSILGSTFLLLLHFPEYQDKLVAEVNHVLKQEGGRQEVEPSDKMKCPLFEAVEMEVHRLITTVPLGIPRLCNKDIVFNRHVIKKNTNVRYFVCTKFLFVALNC